MIENMNIRVADMEVNIIPMLNIIYQELYVRFFHMFQKIEFTIVMSNDFILFDNVYC
jgi:hypothetical protein